MCWRHLELQLRHVPVFPNTTVNMQVALKHQHFSHSECASPVQFLDNALLRFLGPDPGKPVKTATQVTVLLASPLQPAFQAARCCAADNSTALHHHESMQQC